VDAAIKDDEARFRREDKRWSDNAGEIAEFLAGANPNWPEGDVADLLAQHLKLTKGEVAARFDEDWDRDVKSFDDIYTEILTMADALSDGLVAQFPERFDGQRTSRRGASNGTPATESLRAAMRKLWSDHVIWTRQYIVSAIAGPHGLTDVAEHVPLGQAGRAVTSTAQAALSAVPLAEADAAAARLLRNQEDIGNAIVPFYGEDAGKKLTDLLKSHIMIAVELVAAAKAGDNKKFEQNDQEWEENADEIAVFLAGANPNWPEADVRDLLAQHLSLTKGEAVARLEQDWERDVQAFDDIYTEILTMADALSEGIVKQFPDRFGGDASPRAGGMSATPARPTARQGHEGKTSFHSSFGAGSPNASASMATG
jgi:hypothetical protein